MKYIYLFLIVVTFYASTEAGGVQLSARDGISFLSFPAYSKIQVVYFTKFSFSVKYNFDNTNRADLRLGYLLGTDKAENYSGPEIGIYYQRLLLYESGTYGFFGINTHTPSTLDSDSQLAVFASFGLGLPLGRIVSFEITYNKAIKENYERDSGIKYEFELGIIVSLN